MDDKQMLHDTLRSARDDLVGKLDGLGEYDVRRPMTPTGTSLLGLVKHVAGVTYGYFSASFGRDPGIALPVTYDDDDPEADLWVLATEPRAQILEMYTVANRVADETIAALDLDSPGQVPWWAPDKRDVTLGRVMAHLIAEIARHAGHADILRELIDGQAGRWPGDPSIGHWTPEEWATHRADVERAAHEAAR